MSLPIWAARNGKDAQVYWESRAAQYRALIASFLSTLSPVRSLVEVGCHACANLWAIRQQYPHAQLYGIDPSEALLTEARALWTADAVSRMTVAQAADYRAGRLPENLGLELLAGAAPGCVDGFGEVLQANGATVEIGLTVYTLAYMTVREADETLEALTRLVTKAIVVCEPMVDGDEEQRVEEPGRIPAVARDYAAWFGLFHPDWRVQSLPFPGPQHLNRLVIARRP